MAVRAPNGVERYLVLAILTLSSAMQPRRSGVEAQAPGGGFVGAVYVMSNRSDTNTIIAYGRGADGALTLIGAFASGGPGTGSLHPPSLEVSDANDPLISADSLRLSSNGDFLLAVNSLVNSLSSFRILSDYSLELVDTIDTEGQFPNSVAEYNGVVFVPHIGDVFNHPAATPIDSINASVTGFRLDTDTGARTMLSQGAGDTRI